MHRYPLRFMEAQQRRPKRVVEPVDEWLYNEGYYRKSAPKDPTCLFRAVSEQVYNNQRSHLRVRSECVQFMRENKQLFEERISTPFNNYLDQMACFTQWGGMNEIYAISLLYQRNIIIFHGQKLTKDVSMNKNFNDNIYLCFTPPKQYESVFTQEHTANAGFCQSLVYQILYKNVFNMSNVDNTVNKMLHEKNNYLRHDKFFLAGNLEIRNQLTLELFDKLEDGEESEETQRINQGITPFPYRVAKALDPNIYRNIDCDIWHELKKGVRNCGYTKFNSNELQNGSKCLVQIDIRENDKANNNFLTSRESLDNSKTAAKNKSAEPLFYTGHIQEISKKNEPVLVFIEELGQKMTVPYETLKPFPQKKMKNPAWPVNQNKKNQIVQNPKWKKPWNSSGRKPKDQVPADNNLEKNQIATSDKDAIKKADCVSEISPENPAGTGDKCVSNNIVENKKTLLENTSSSVQNNDTDQKVVQFDNKSNNTSSVKSETSVNNKQQNFPENAQPNKQNNSRNSKNDIFYPPSGAHFPIHFSGEPETTYNNYAQVKNSGVEANDLPHSADSMAPRQYYGAGAKPYYWPQNTWSHGINGPPQYAENHLFMAQVPPQDPNYGVNITNGAPVINNEPYPLLQQQSNNSANNNRRTNSPQNQNNRQKQNQRSNNDHRGGGINRNKAEYKNSEQIAGKGKQNAVAPRFKRNNEGRNSRNNNEPLQPQQQQQQQHNPNQQQYQHHRQQVDYDFRNNRKQQNQQQAQPHLEMHTQMANHPVEISDIHHQPQQLPNHSQQTMMQPQASPPPPLHIQQAYAYPMAYNQQVPFVPIGHYPPDAEVAYPAQFYQPAPGFIQLPFIAGAEIPPDGSPGPVAPMYQGPIEGFAAQAQYPVYSQYIYHPGPIYSSQLPPPPPSQQQTPSQVNEQQQQQQPCYSQQPPPLLPPQFQQYFFPYPPPPPPPQSTPAPSH